MFYCRFCKKECKNDNSLRNHERLCPKNPDRDISYITNRLNRTPWHKGLSKDIDERLKSRGEKLHNRYESGELIGSFKGRKHSQETIDKLSDIAIQNQYEQHFGSHKSYQYNETVFISSYEIKLAKSLDENNIKWVKPERLPYIAKDNTKHNYTPDFYLPEYDVYLDPKNDYLIENINPTLGYNDVEKIHWVMEQNNVKIIVLNKNELEWNVVKNKIN